MSPLVASMFSERMFSERKHQMFSERNANSRLLGISKIETKMEPELEQ